MSCPKCLHIAINTELSYNDSFHENKENVVNLEPSKAWIRNVGVGSAKKPLKRFLCPNHTLVVPSPNTQTPRRKLKMPLGLESLTPSRIGAYLTPPDALTPVKPIILCSPTTFPSNESNEMENITKYPNDSVDMDETPVNQNRTAIHGVDSNSDDGKNRHNPGQIGHSSENTVIYNKSVDSAVEKNGEPESESVAKTNDEDKCEASDLASANTLAPIEAKQHTVTDTATDTATATATNTDTATDIAIAKTIATATDVFDGFVESMVDALPAEWPTINSTQFNTLIPFNSTELSTTFARLENALADSSCASYSEYSLAFFCLILNIF